MGTSDVLKVLKIARVVGECNLKTSDHKARNARASSDDFFIYCILNKITPSLCFHSNFRIALYNLFMHSSLTNQKRDILYEYLFLQGRLVL